MSPRKRGKQPAKKRRTRNQPADATLTDYELSRMKQCLLNNAHMRQLGLPVVSNLFVNTGISPEKQKQKNQEDSGSEYNGHDEANSDGYLSDAILDPGTNALQELESTLGSLADKNKTEKRVNKRGVRKAQPPMQLDRVTRSMKKCPARVNDVINQAETSIQATQEAVEGQQSERDEHIADAGQQNGGQNEGDGHIHTELNQDGHTENVASMNEVNENEHTQGGIDSQDDPFDEEDWMRGPNIGRKLDQMTHSRKGKLPLVIEPEKKRPNSVMIAVKFATKCNIAARNHVPIFPHWKEYKKKHAAAIIKEYINRVCSKFQTDVNSPPVKKACVTMMKKAVRQQRYKLKKKYFDACPLHLVPKTTPVTSMSNDEWDKLVTYWKNEEKMVTCEKNKANRSKVQFHQTTGSRSYEMHTVNLENKYQNGPPNALDIFKECHYSKKKGFTPAVQSIIVEMKNKINAPVDDGEEPKDVTDVVSEVLVQNTKKNRFLVNVGMKSTCW